MTPIRAALARVPRRSVLVVVAIAAAVVFVLPRLPRPVAGVGTLDECALMSAPIVVLDGDAWRQALPDGGVGAPNMLPVAAWPDGLRYDDATDTLRDPDGTVRFRRGDRVRISGTIVEVHGDPSPCYYTRHVRIDSIEAGDPAVSTLPPPSTPSGAELLVHLGGAINCGQFPYGCYATLSVAPTGTKVEAAWRPPASDPQWVPDRADTEAFDPTPFGTIPTLAPGGHRIVISLLGSYDTVSYAPDGSVARDLLSRCTLDVDVDPADGPVEIQVTFTPDGVSFGGTCSIEPVG